MNAARRSMADLAKEQFAAVEADPRVPDPATPEVTESQTPELPESQSPRGTDSRTPGFRELERKEVYARADQLAALTALRRRLNRARPSGQGERITENTLIRVAIDLLLGHADELQGITESELRESVTARVPGYSSGRNRSEG